MIGSVIGRSPIKYNEKIFWGIVIIFGIFEIIIFVYALFCEYKENRESYRKYKEELEIYEKTKSSNHIRYNENCKKAKMQESVLRNIESELKKAIDVRNEIYNVNWIPNQYRDIRVVYYICDMVITSNISIEESIKYYLLQETNNKLDCILKKMDRIIELQKKSIAVQAVLEAQNAKVIEENSTMISKLSCVEKNTRLAADYARIGVAYSAVNAYFSVAQYLKD